MLTPGFGTFFVAKHFWLSSFLPKKSENYLTLHQVVEHHGQTMKKEEQ